MIPGPPARAREKMDHLPALGPTDHAVPTSSLCHLHMLVVDLQMLSPRVPCDQATHRRPVQTEVTKARGTIMNSNARDDGVVPKLFLPKHTQAGNASTSTEQLSGGYGEAPEVLSWMCTFLCIQLTCINIALRIHQFLCKHLADLTYANITLRINHCIRDNDIPERVPGSTFRERTESKLTCNIGALRHGIGFWELFTLVTLRKKTEFLGCSSVKSRAECHLQLVRH